MNKANNTTPPFCCQSGGDNINIITRTYVWYNMRTIEGYEKEY